MELEFARELRRRLLLDCDITGWDEENSFLLDEEMEIPGLEASGCKILFSYRGITFKENICLQRITQDLDLQSKMVQWKGGRYLAIYTDAK